jgi:hypothetical protein
VVTFDNDDENGNGQWGEAANWDTGSLPGAADRVVIPADLTAFIDGSEDFTVDSLKIEADGTLWIVGSAADTRERQSPLRREPQSRLRAQGQSPDQRHDQHR